jgi:hypothetical protein
MPAPRLEHRVAEQVLDRDVGQVAGDEGLVVGPQPTSRVDKPRAYISLTSDSSTSLLPSRKLITPRSQRRAGTANLRHGDVDEPLGSAQPAPLVAVARAKLIVTASLVTAPAAQKSACSASNS